MNSQLARWTLLALLPVPVSTWAFGLGEIELESGFSEPLRARIELLSASPEILQSLRVGMAPVASFEQFAVDRPSFLTSFEFTIGRDEAGRNVLLVTSPEPISELFVTMLVEARWSGGAALREYTMLLDLPVRQAEAPAVVDAAPLQQPQPNVVAEEIEQPANASDPELTATSMAGATQVASTPSASTPENSSSEVQTHGPVQRAETLWDIAMVYRPAGVTMNQAMVAIYEANPQAFGNNMNVLRMGAVLQIPDLVALRDVAANTAALEVERQTAEWQDRTSQAAPSAVPSQSEAAEEAVQATQAPAPIEDTQISVLQDQIVVLQSDLEDIRRELAIRDEELSDLRAQLAAGAERASAAPPALATAAPSPAAGAGAALESIPMFPDEFPVPDSTAAEPGEQSPTAVRSVQSAPDLATVPEERSAVAQALRLILEALAAAGAAAVLVTALLLWRRRRRDSVADSAYSADNRPTLDETIDTGDTAQIAAPFAKALNDDIVVHEQQVDAHTRGRHDASLLVEEIADSLAETGFHMAAGSYDQAAAQVLKEIENDPENRGLKLRLAEVYFQWGNKGAFLQLARELRAVAREPSDGVWDKVVIMGQQILPEEELFTAAPVSAGELDLHLQELDAAPLDLAFDEQDGAELDVDFGGADDAEPDATDDAVTVRAEAAEQMAARAAVVGDGEAAETVDLPATAATSDAGADAALDSGELPRPERNTTVTQEWRGLDESATLEELAVNASSLTATCEMPDATMSEGPDDNTTREMPDAAISEAQDDNTTRETTLPSESRLGDLADNEGQALDLGDDVLTKLDLAKAYQTIGQPELAIPLLEEALQEAEGGPEKTQVMLEEALQEAEAAVEEAKKRSA